jgi:hypothetical protein
MDKFFDLTRISFCDILVARRLFGVVSKQSLAFFDKKVLCAAGAGNGRRSLRSDSEQATSTATWGPFDCAKCRQGYAKWGKLRKEADVRGVGPGSTR